MEKIIENCKGSVSWVSQSQCTQGISQYQLDCHAPDELEDGRDTDFQPSSVSLQILQLFFGKRSPSCLLTKRESAEKRWSELMQLICKATFFEVGMTIKGN